MQVHFVSIHRLLGLSKLGDAPDDMVFFAQREPRCRALITSNPEPYFDHIDRTAKMPYHLARGVFRKDATSDSIEAQLVLDAEERRAERAKEGRAALCMVFEGTAEVPTIEFDYRRDVGWFSVAVGDGDKVALRKPFNGPLTAALMSMILTLPDKADTEVEEIGKALYITSDGDGVLYPFVMKGGSVRILTGTLLSQAQLDEASLLSSKLTDEVTQSAKLLALSLEKKTEALPAYLAAWAALEIFVNTSFKLVYQNEWNAVPREVRELPPFLAKLASSEVRLHLAGKFSVLAWFLDAKSAAGDVEIFVRLKKQRDRFFHLGGTDTDSLMTDDIQRLLRKYLRLHSSDVSTLERSA